MYNWLLMYLVHVALIYLYKQHCDNLLLIYLCASCSLIELTFNDVIDRLLLIYCGCSIYAHIKIGVSSIIPVASVPLGSVSFYNYGYWYIVIDLFVHSQTLLIHVHMVMAVAFMVLGSVSFYNYSFWYMVIGLFVHSQTLLIHLLHGYGSCICPHGISFSDFIELWQTTHQSTHG